MEEGKSDNPKTNFDDTAVILSHHKLQNGLISCSMAKI